MKNSIKGAIYSGLVFPGLGQIILKHYKRGIAIIFSFIMLIILTAVVIVRQVLAIFQKIDFEVETLDVHAIINTTNNIDSFSSNFLIVCLTLGWILSIIDAYRIGKKMDVDGKEAG